MKKQPITIIIRNKNSAKTILRTLESVANQTLDGMLASTLVIDDDSSDDSISKIRKHFPEVNIIKSAHPGAMYALNLGLENITTPHFTILDSDDALPLNTMEIYEGLSLKQLDSAAIYGNYEEISTTGARSLISTKDNIFNTIAGGILFNTRDIKEIGGYDTELFFPEYDLLIKLLARNSVVHLDKTVYYYFRQPRSLTANSQQVAIGIEQLKNKYGKIFPIREY